MPRQAAAQRKLVCAVMGIAGSLALAAQLRGDSGRALGDAPQFQNAHVEIQALRGPLEEEIRRWASASEKARWLGYAVEQVHSDHAICCSNYNSSYDGRCSICKLENTWSSVNINSREPHATTIHLESSADLAVMFRAENGKVTRIRIFSLQCIADAGGLDVEWLENVKASDSVSLLEKCVTADGASEEYPDSLSKSALTALALHADASADGALESFVSLDRPERLRRETAFWLGDARGATGLHTLQKMAKNDPSTQVREQVTFALSVSDQPGALPEIIRMAHEDESPHVRGEALFWLAQKAGKKAENAITAAIQNDPNTEVKEKAVFALSQMPKDEGIPKLIEVAQRNKNPEVRKKAMFWLGQSQDPRALAFFEQILAQ